MWPKQADIETVIGPLYGWFMEKITDSRVEAMLCAIELGVDLTDFAFYSMAERVLWRELAAELEEFLAKHGPTWVAEAA